MSDDTRNKDQNSYLTSSFTILYTGITGYIVNGNQGAVIGATIATIDQHLISSNNFITQYYNKNYLSLYSYWHFSFAKGIKSSAYLFKIIFSPYLKAIFPKQNIDKNIDRTSMAFLYILPAIQTWFADDFLNFQEKTLVPLNALSLINKMFDKDNIFAVENINKTYHELTNNPLNAPEILKDNFSKFYENKFQTSYAKIFALSIINEGINFYLYTTLSGDAINDIFSKLISKDKEHYLKLKKFSSKQIIDLLFHRTDNDQIPKAPTLVRATSAPAKMTFPTDIPVATQEMSITDIESFQELVKNYSGSTAKLLFLYYFGSLLDNKLKQIIIHEKKKAQDALCVNSLNIIEEYEKDHQGKTLLSSHQDIFTQHSKDINNAFVVAFKINEIASDAFKSLSSYSKIMTHTSEIFVYNAILLPFTQYYYLKPYLEDSRKNSKDLATTEAQEKQNAYSIINHVESIAQTDSLNYLLSGQNQILNKKSELYAKEAEIANDISTLKKNEPIYSIVIGSPYLFYKFTQDNGEATIISLFNILSSMNQLMSYYSYNILSKIGTTKEEISLNNLQSFLNITNKADHNMIHYTSNHEAKIIYSNFSIYKENVTISHVDYLSFDLSHKYLINDYNFIHYCKGLKKAIYAPFNGSGIISISLTAKGNPNIVYIDQHPYFPNHLTLLESIYFPKKLSSLPEKEVKKLRMKIIDLFTKFKNTHNDYIELNADLDNKHFKLKPEQAKKIFIIRAIINQADIIIMDETFTGLDTISINAIKNVINKELENVTIFSFEKQPINDSFYDYLVSHTNNTFTKTAIIPDYSPAIIDEVEAQGICSSDL